MVTCKEGVDMVVELIEREASGFSDNRPVVIERTGWEKGY